MVFGFGVLIFNFFCFGFGLVFACVHGFFFVCSLHCFFVRFGFGAAQAHVLPKADWEL